MTLEQLSAFVAYATAPGRFYRKLYGMKEGDAPQSVRSWDEWRALPFLTKKDLSDAPLSERSFLPLRDVTYLTVSSGTSGSLPLFSPRSYMPTYEFRTRLYPFSKAVLSSKPVPFQHEEFLSRRGVSPRLVVLDPRNMAASARLARAAGVDAIFTFTSFLLPLAQHMTNERIAEHIRFIEIGGAVITRSCYETARKAFPNAIIVSTYGLSDIENSPVGLPCRPVTGEEPLDVFHPKECVFMELYDDATRSILEPSAGTEGELVVSAYCGEPSAFPTIRYRTGDLVRVAEEQCAVHGTPSFTVLGRIDADFVTIPGGMVRVDELERVLRLFPNVVPDTFQARIRKETREQARIGMTLHVVPRGTINLVALAESVSRELRVGPAHTYADGVKKGLYTPLTCSILERPRDEVSKSKRIIVE